MQISSLIDHDPSLIIQMSKETLLIIEKDWLSVIKDLVIIIKNVDKSEFLSRFVSCYTTLIYASLIYQHSCLELNENLKELLDCVAVFVGFCNV
jgi:hypothetical protein